MGFGTAEPFPPAATMLRRLLLSGSKARNLNPRRQIAMDSDSLTLMAELAIALAGFSLSRDAGSPLQISSL